ncbi:MAG: M28 family peptidase, partial [Phycisphaerales bacterium]
MMRVLMSIAALSVSAVALATTGSDWDDVRYKYWPQDQREAYAALERRMLELPSAERLAEMHEQLASVPHPAGSIGDALTVDRIEALMTEFGLKVERHPIWVYISRPVDAKLEIIEPERIELSLKERPIERDPDTSHEDLDIGWNAYSGSGDVFGSVVYANYGRIEDFERLEQLGVSVTGKIVICRYGQIFRGLKAKHAEEAGAIGLILYTDPEDDGWGKGRAWPEGGYANETSIQRGGLKTLPQPGDPLTPKREATEDANRIDEDVPALPVIPVQPIGWGAAQQILGRMTGEVAPPDWHGGLPFPYAVEGGGELKVRLMVEQVREVVKTWNVIGTIEGTGGTDTEVFVGSHHDAWGFGASDPLSGTICMLEAARTLAEVAKEHPPYRTMRFCAWAAEEHGIIGSTEYVESRMHFMSQWAVAYINLDMSAMGPNFGAMSSPGLRTLIAEVARDVPQAGDPSKSVFDAWVARGEDPNVPGQPRFSDVGGGSDHLPFWGVGCMSVCGLGA